MTNEEVKNDNKYKFAINRLMCGNTAHSCKADYIKTAIEALEKQIPKKPTVFKGNAGEWDLCPCCNGVLIYYLEHCHLCGQAIDWSEVE